MTQHYIGTKQIEAWPDTKDGKDGYAVKYADGYTSWSPKDVFEAAYLPIGHVGGKPAYQQRVIGEKALLDDKVQKLSTFLHGDRAAFNVGAEELERLEAQLRVMVSYSDILAQRIAAF
ncbi:crAss001_48 related protein [Ralstonia insidiosa]|uniref:crAss001_48 related protein n=1 Tax=Ralstonia insidiosa TaxID=190721 RepID=UPI000CED9B84|nr:hypothetical protein [Ralstonia insidiosa]